MRHQIPRNVFMVTVLVLMAGAFLFQNSRTGGADLPMVQMKTARVNGNLVLPQSQVAVVQSVEEDATHIEATGIEDMVRSAVALAGGFDDLIQDGDVVILKPNLIAPYDMTVSKKLLPPEVNGIATDYRVAQAVVNLVREINPNGQVYILEGVAEMNTNYNMSHLKYTSAHMTGVDDFIHLEKRSGGWREYNSPLLVKKTIPDNVKLYPNNMKPNRTDDFYLNRVYYEADVIISLPVLKNHSLTNITGSVKNVGIGATPANIYGGNPDDNHRFVNNTINHTPYYLHRWIHDYFLCKPVDFTIMDGLQGTSDGPVGMGSSKLADVQQNMRLILASRDAVAIDAIASLLMGYDPLLITHLVLLHNHDAGCADPNFIRIEGEWIHPFKKKFDNYYKDDINAWYTDYTPPSFTVNSIRKEGGDLVIELAADEDLSKVEIEMDGIRHNHCAVDGFNEMRFNMGSISDGPHQVTIYGYDRYLNCTTETLNIVTAISDGNHQIPGKIALQNYPNPFNPTTTIVYSLNRPAHVRMIIYDMAGTRVQTLVDERQSEGIKSVHWNGRNDQGRKVASGSYICRLQTAEAVQTIKLVLMK